MWAYLSSRPGLSLYSKLPLAIGTAYYVTSLGVNLLLTILIITRLLLYRRAVSKSLPAGYTNHYLSVATIVVESVLLYSIFALAFIITYALNNPMNQIFMYMGSACQVRIPPLSMHGVIAIAFAANRRLHDYTKSRPRTRVDIKYASIDHEIYRYTFLSTGFHHPRHH